MPSGTYVDTNNKNTYPSRSSRNSRLYREVYGKYEDLDNLPIDDNTDEIDMERLREIVYSSERTKEFREIKDDLDVLDVRKRTINNERVHDINKLLEKAKYENSKLKEPVGTKYNKDILSTLQVDKVGSSNLSEKEDVGSFKEYQDESNMYMTREFKFKELNEKISELNSNPLMENVMDDSEFSLDLFEDLKPTTNTIVTKPIVDSDEKYQSDFHSSDTSDIDIIKEKPVVSKEREDDFFFTNSYSFKDKDFNGLEQDDFFEEKKSHGGIFKIILLLLAILVFSFVIVYFVLNYGIGV